MAEQGYDIPVVLIVFNRPELVERQFKTLEMIKPERLYLVSDAPRENVSSDYEKVDKVRRIFEDISWRCDLRKIFAEQNMGCDRRVVSGLNFVFQQEEAAVILEDDCMPHPDFFFFCRELLIRYRNEPKIMYISGCKWVPDYKMPYSYGFSYNTGTWGWATWHRAWKEWHWDKQEWEAKKEEWLKDVYSKRYRQNWIADMERYFDKGSIPWDYIWRFCVGKRLSIFPAKNLIENVGFGQDATHTSDQIDGYDGKVSALGEIVHPPTVSEDLIYPKMEEKRYKNTIYRRIKRKIRRSMEK